MDRTRIDIGMDGKSTNRCGYIWPEDHEVGSDPNDQSCCWRESIGTVDRCVWHADPRTITKSVQALQEARAAHNGEEGSNIQKASGHFTELLDGAKLSGLDLRSQVNFERVALRSADLSDTDLRDATLSGACLQDADLSGTLLRDADLSGATLSGANLSGATLSGADLTGALLRNVDLSDAKFVRANLSNAKFPGSDLSNASFRGADLSNARLSSVERFWGDELLRYFSPPEAWFSEADLSGTTFRDATLSGTDLRGTNLSDKSLPEADLSSAQLQDANLSGVLLRDADLPNAKFRNADLSDGNFRGTDLSGAVLRGADLSDGKFSNADLSEGILSGADLSDALIRDVDLPNANLRDAALPNADLVRADLSNADLVRADLSNADLRDADLSNADLRDADLSDATLQGANLSDATLQDATLSDADLQDAELSNANLEHTVLIRTNLFGVDLTDARPHGATFTDVQINDDTAIRSDNKRDAEAQWWQRGPFRVPQRCGYDPERDSDHRFETIPLVGVVYRGLRAVNSETSPPDTLGRAADTYQTFERLARENARPALQSEMFVLRQDMQRKRHWHNSEFVEWAFAWLSRGVFKHGESLARIVAWAVVIVAAYAAIYTRFDLIVSRDGSIVTGAVDALYFSTLTFTTLGLGDFQPDPTSELARLLVTSQAALGAILIAIFVFVLGRRAAK
jgi:uncharacterized protein YjbI with pentapeptide repeats